MRRTTSRIATLSLAALLALPACRTRLYGLDEDGGADAAPDAEESADLLGVPVRDLSIAPLNCGVTTIQTTQIVRADLLVIQDRSRSMAQGVTGSNNPPAGQSKWDLVSAAIKKVVAGTTTVDWGLMLFGNGVLCNVPATPDVPVGPGNAARITQLLNAAQLAPGTPTTAALKNSLAAMLALKDDHPRYMLLATDGQPDCGGGNTGTDDSAAAIAAVANAKAAGIATFVVGIGANTGAEQTLTAMAAAGGVPNDTPGQPLYYPVTSSQDLVNILEKAALKITPCKYPLPVLPPNPDEVLIEGPFGTIPRDVNHQEGWDYDDDGKSVSFYGLSCLTLKERAVISVQATYACPRG